MPHRVNGGQADGEPLSDNLSNSRRYEPGRQRQTAKNGKQPEPFVFPCLCMKRINCGSNTHYLRVKARRIQKKPAGLIAVLLITISSVRSYRPMRSLKYAAFRMNLASR